MSAWSQGDTKAGDQLVERHFELVYRLVAALTPPTVEVSDVVQRTFLACLERGDEIEKVERFRPYLLGIARNQVRMRMRYDRRRQGEQPVEDPATHARSSWAPRLSAVAAEREQQRVLLLALRRLPIEQQLPLELHYWEGMSTREIGELLDLKPGAVKKRLFDARRRLAEWMGQLARDEATAQLSLRQFDQWAQTMRALVHEDDGVDDTAHD
ncbi:MAG: sigma-70 family RNA polymerase sigma factor [Deltaproteobacteria bacterium]|nr:sigma-70 family RNA polymerase sigma factor [Deltaproteobacteria bacterium]